MKIKYAAFFIAALLVSSCSVEKTHRAPYQPELTAFVEIPVPLGDNPWRKESQPFVGATAIDIDGDGWLEVFIGGGSGNEDALLAYREGTLVNIIEGSGLSATSATHGANSVDIDGDGDTDLIIARSEGVYLYRNKGGVFSAEQIPVTLPRDSEPLNVAVGDIDKDGDGDLYISVFVDLAHFVTATYNDPEHAKANRLLLNTGNGRFQDITDAAGAASLQNTFVSSFIDLDQDSWPDLVVAQNTGQVEFYRNRGDLTFERKPVATGYGFWMNLGAGDIDKDGDQDLFFSNSGSSIPKFLLTVIDDLKDDQPPNFGWLLLRNEGDFAFTEVTAAYRLDGQGFGWGGVFEDVTLDGNLDLLVAQNYIKWTIHKWSKLSSKSYVQLQDKGGSGFYHMSALGLENSHFAQAPLFVDIDNDGRQDVFWINMEGRSRALLNRSPGNFLTLCFPDTVRSIGARAYLETAAGRSYTREVLNNIGMSTDQTTALSFGLGNEERVERVVIHWPDGTVQVLQSPAINQQIKLKGNGLASGFQAPPKPEHRGGILGGKRPR